MRVLLLNAMARVFPYSFFKQASPPSEHHLSQSLPITINRLLTSQHIFLKAQTPFLTCVYSCLTPFPDLHYCVLHERPEQPYRAAAVACKFHSVLNLWAAKEETNIKILALQGVLSFLSHLEYDTRFKKKSLFP